MRSNMWRLPVLLSQSVNTVHSLIPFSVQHFLLCASEFQPFSSHSASRKPACYLKGSQHGHILHFRHATASLTTLRAKRQVFCSKGTGRILITQLLFEALNWEVMISLLLIGSSQILCSAPWHTFASIIRKSEISLSPQLALFWLLSFEV